MRLIRYASLVALLTLVWVVLNERFDWMTLLVGVVIGSGSIVVTNRLVLKQSYRTVYHLRPWKAFIYLLRLFYEIYAAGFLAVFRMLTRDTHIGVVDIRTDLTDEFAICLLANSITLTPGTVTLDRDGQNLKVIWLNASTRDPVDAGRQIKGLFETLLREVVQ